MWRTGMSDPVFVRCIEDPSHTQCRTGPGSLFTEGGLQCPVPLRSWHCSPQSRPSPGPRPGTQSPVPTSLWDWHSDPSPGLDPTCENG